VFVTNFGKCQNVREVRDQSRLAFRSRFIPADHLCHSIAQNYSMAIIPIKIVRAIFGHASVVQHFNVGARSASSTMRNSMIANIRLWYRNAVVIVLRLRNTSILRVQRQSADSVALSYKTAITSILLSKMDAVRFIIPARMA
jgi:hypothetical protein